MAAGPVGFDLDMTLIDSRPAIIAAFEAMSRDMSVSVDLNAVDGRLGSSSRTSSPTGSRPTASPRRPVATAGTTSG